MTSAPSHPRRATLRRRLAALRPGRPTALACGIAIALAAVSPDSPRPHPGTPADDPPGVVLPAAEPSARMALAHSGLVPPRRIHRRSGIRK